jgi:Glycosyltransferase family 87
MTEQRATPAAESQNSNRRAWIAANVAASAGLIFFALYYLTAFRFDALFTEQARQVDFFIWRFIPSYIFENARYPAIVTGDWTHTLFPYLPSAAAMMLPLGWPAETPAFALWLVIQLAAFATVVLGGLRLSGAAMLRARWLIAIAAVLLSENSLSWDLRNHNTNLVYLALVVLGLQASRTWLAAGLLALSINWKLYSGFVPLALAWRREFRLAAATCVACVLIAVVLPLAAFGPSAYLQLMSDWLAQIRYTATVHSGATASLIRSIATLLGADPGTDIVTLALRATQTAWLALVAWYFLSTRNLQPVTPAAFRQARLSDVCVALMAPLPLSTWFLPYHAVVMLPAYMILLTAAIADGSRTPTRAIAAGAIAACQVAHFALPRWDYRGLMFLVSFVFVLLALAAVRRALNDSRPESQLQAA